MGSMVMLTELLCTTRSWESHLSFQGKVGGFFCSSKNLANPHLAKWMHLAKENKRKIENLNSWFKSILKVQKYSVL